MSRIFGFFQRRKSVSLPDWQLTADQHQRLLELLSEIGLQIVDQSKGPVPLLTFGRRVLDRLQPGGEKAVPLPDFANALKHIIRDMKHDRLRVMSPTDFVGVGYVFNAANPDSWPFQSSR